LGVQEHFLSFERLCLGEPLGHRQAGGGARATRAVVITNCFPTASNRFIK
jgi:hypothetical protein